MLFVNQTETEDGSESAEETRLHVAESDGAESIADSMASEVSTTSTIHRDERQIGLDTNRSFVLYPVGELLCFSASALH